MKSLRRHGGLYLIAAYIRGLWSMIECLVFNLKNMRLWKASGGHGLNRLGMAGFVDDLGDYVRGRAASMYHSRGTICIVFSQQGVPGVMRPGALGEDLARDWPSPTPLFSLLFPEKGIAGSEEAKQQQHSQPRRRQTL